MSTTSKGNYYKKKTKEYFEKLGYETQLTEFTTTRPIGGGKVIYVKKDVFSSDGISMNGKEIIFWNSKHMGQGQKLNSDGQVSSGKKDFNKHNFPDCVKRQLVIWESRKQPVIINI